MGEMDFLNAKARVGISMKASLPLINSEGRVVLRQARHPLLERTLESEGKAVVPLDLTLTREKHILVISGPNAGGKSVCLKTVGLLQYMFQWGMLIPTSEISEMTVFSNMVSIPLEADSLGDFSLKFTNALGLKVLGLTIERCGGVSVDNFSLRGNSGTVLQRLNAEECAELNSVRPYDLIILEYGLNVASDSTRTYGWYSVEMQHAVSRLRQNFPDADFLILGVSDRAHNTGAGLETMSIGYVLHFLPQHVFEDVRDFVTRSPLVLQALYLVLAILIVVQFKTAGVQPFIYFQF